MSLSISDARGGAESVRETSMPLRVKSHQQVSSGVSELVLVADDSSELPSWTPGSHIDVQVRPGLVRQYSLCGDPEDRSQWRIAVLREPESRGGSAALCERVQPGDVLTATGPRNHFPLHDSPQYLFIAGGIGITPIIPMIAAAHAAGAEWRLVYGGRSEASMAYRDEVGELRSRARTRMAAGSSRPDRTGSTPCRTTARDVDLLLWSRTADRGRRGEERALAAQDPSGGAVRAETADRGRSQHVLRDRTRRQ